LYSGKDKSFLFISIKIDKNQADNLLDETWPAPIIDLESYIISGNFDKGVAL
jgi:hypothetical protein